MKPADYILLAIVLGTALLIVLRGIRQRRCCGGCRCSCSCRSCSSRNQPAGKEKQ